jgi:endogenous inhibitor of DNA gyrase (YacG/DUF329 family)
MRLKDNFWLVLLLVLGVVVLGKAWMNKLTEVLCPACGLSIKERSNPCPHCKTPLLWQTTQNVR